MLASKVMDDFFKENDINKASAIWNLTFILINKLLLYYFY